MGAIPRQVGLTPQVLRGYLEAVAPWDISIEGHFGANPI